VWFAVPVEDEQYVLGLVARHVHPTVYGYFFPIRATLQALAALVFDHPPIATDSHTQKFFSDLAFSLEHWPVMAPLESSEFDPSAWPIVECTRSAPFPQGERHFASLYGEDDLLTKVAERRVSAEEASVMPPEGHAGSQFVREWLPSTLPPDIDR
jgi:hypothetical protein